MVSGGQTTRGPSTLRREFEPAVRKVRRHEIGGSGVDGRTAAL